MTPPDPSDVCRRCGHLRSASIHHPDYARPNRCAFVEASPTFIDAATAPWFIDAASGRDETDARDAPPRRRVFQCAKCNAPIDSIEVLARHVGTCGPVACGVFACAVCHELFDNVAVAGAHASICRAPAPVARLDLSPAAASALHAEAFELVRAELVDFKRSLITIASILRPLPLDVARRIVLDAATAVGFPDALIADFTRGMDIGFAAMFQTRSKKEDGPS